MHDWRLLVQQRLAGLLIEDGEAAQVVEELAGHLEENYQSLLRDGLAEEIAARRALEKVNDWQDLKRKLESSRNKEAIVNKRVTQFWFPAFLTLALSMVLLAVIQIFGPAPWVDNPLRGGRLRMTPVAVVYVSWLIFLPLIGALGAYLSHRAGGRKLTVFSSIVFPVFPYMVFFAVGLPIAIMFDDRVSHNITIPAFFAGLAGWVIFPAAALLGGGLACSAFRFSIAKR